MNVTRLIPDLPATPPALPGEDAPIRAGNAGAFARALDGVGAALAKADGAEDRFAAHAGSLQDAVYERAQADVLLSIATASAQRATQAVQSILNMAV